MDKNTRLLFIGLDSAEPTDLLAWMDAGILPNLRALRDRGAWSRVTNMAGFGNGVMWPCVYTGVSPGVHGRYFRDQFCPETYETPEFTCEDLRVEPFWSVLSRKGKRVAIIDFMRAPYTRRLNGIQLVDVLGHNPQHANPMSWPPDLIEEVHQRFGRDVVRYWDGAGRDPETAHLRLRDNLIDRLSRKTDLSRHFLEQGGWDLFMTSFGEAHDTGHQQWHLHDPRCPRYDGAWVAKHGDPVKDIYVALDAAVGRLVDSAGPEAAVVVMAGPGMEPNFTGNHLLDEFLRRLENGPAAARFTPRSGVKALYQAVVPKGLRDRVKSMTRPMENSMLARERMHRKAFTVPHNDNAAAVRINVVGRESHGLVNPGADYEAFVAELTTDLLAATNLGTGGPMVEEVVRISDCCHGPHVGDLPDLLVIWNRDGPIEKVHSPKFGDLHMPYTGIRSGDHTQNALFIAAGPAFEPGELSAQPTAMDLAPTMAAVLGETLPQAEGKPITESRDKPQAPALAPVG